MPPRVPAFAPTVEDETQVIAPPTVPEVEEEPERISTVAVPTVVPQIVDDVEWAISLAPEPDKLRSVYDTAIALSEGLGVPVWQAFSQAQALADGGPEPKRLGEAIKDEWDSAFVGQKRGDLGTQAKEAFRAGRMDDYADFLYQSKQLKMPPPDTERRNFLERMLLGGANIAGQQVAGLVSTGQQVAGGSVQRRLEDVGQFAKNALTFHLRDQARLVAGLPAKVAETTGIGRGEGGNSFLDMVGGGVPPEIAAPLSDTVATLNTGIELLSDATMLKLFGPLKGRVAGVLKSLGQKLGWDGTMVQLGLRIATKWVAGAATNLGEEVTQGTITFLAEKAAEVDAEAGGRDVADVATWKSRMAGVVDA